MASIIRNSTVEEIKSRCNIVDVIGEVVQLKKAGSTYKGLCPFHNEKTPSFIVSETKQIFTCFGCHASGDVIEFTRRYHNLSFVEAIEKLAREYNISIDRGQDSNTAIERDKLYEINREAAKFFYTSFYKSPNPAYEYMQKRGIDIETLKKFGIGYADGSWDSLRNYLNSKGYDDESLIQLRLVSKSEKNGKCYDLFRNRVMFPIINTSGKVIAFGGRAILPDDNPKYLNSPETPVFSKKNNLYALNLTKQDIAKEDMAILVEGYMDAISLYQAGIQNVLASLGTALTENQAKLLKRYTKNAILSYDADDAGRNAALRGMDILYDQDIKVKVLHVKDAKDPDEYVKKYGKLAFLKIAEEALSFVEYKVDTLESKTDTNTTAGKIEFIKELSKILKDLRPAEQDIYIKKLSKDYNISEQALRREIGIATEKGQRFYYKKPTPKSKDAISPIEKQLIKFLVTDSSYYKPIAKYSSAFKSDLGKKVYSICKEQIEKGAQNYLLDDIRRELSQDFVDNFDFIDKNILLGEFPDRTLAQTFFKIDIELLEEGCKEIEGEIYVLEQHESEDKERSQEESEALQKEIVKLTNRKKAIDDEIKGLKKNLN